MRLNKILILSIFLLVILTISGCGEEESKDSSVVLTNLEKERAECDKLSRQSDIESFRAATCYTNLAAKYYDETLCKNIFWSSDDIEYNRDITVIERESCIMEVAIANSDLKLCDKLVGSGLPRLSEWHNAECKAIIKKDTGECDVLTINKDLCYRNVAGHYKDIKLCEGIENPDNFYHCMEEVTGDKDYCLKINDKVTRGMCSL